MIPYAFLWVVKAVWDDLSTVKELEENRITHCILATRAVIEAGRYFGVKLEPMPVDILIWNAEAYALVNQGVEVDEWPSSAWGLGVVSNNETTDCQWNGHLIVAGEDVLADFNATQWSRPKKQINLENWVIQRPTEPPPWRFTGKDGTEMHIQPATEVNVYKQSKDWRVNYRPIAAELIRVLKLMETHD